MIDCKVCKKEIRSNNMTRHLRTHNTPYGREAREVGVPEYTKKGYNFFMTFVDGHVKDELAKRLADIEEIKQYIICNETGASGVSNPHSHAVVVLNEAINFINFKKFWDLYELPKYGDIESCKNLRQAFKYCSKEDHLCDFAAIDADYLHHHTTSYLASLRYKTLASTSYPYCRLVGPQRREFEERFTAKRSNQVSLEFDMSAAATGDKANHYHADVLWYGNSKSIKAKHDQFRHHWMKSISFKFHNFKVRTLMRTVTTEGTPPQEYTTEQLIEPSFVNLRYRWDKWGDKVNPGHMVGHDDRIEEVMQTKCIKNCKDKFWGMWKPKGARALMSGPHDGDAGWIDYVKRMRCPNFDENGPPHMDFWFAAEATLPDQFFKPDPPVVRTAKMFVDFDATFYTKWFCSEKKISHS